MVYQWKDTVDFEADAQAVGERLATIARDADGALHPKDVVVDARKPTSPLHHLFEWDDRKAAIAHRLHQAREVITAIVVRVSPTDETTTRAYVQQETDYEAGDGRFVAVDIREERPFVLVPAQERARVELARWIQRYRGRPELAEAVRCAEEALDRIAAVLA